MRDPAGPAPAARWMSLTQAAAAIIRRSLNDDMRCNALNATRWMLLLAKVIVAIDFVMQRALVTRAGVFYVRPRALTAIKPLFCKHLIKTVSTRA